MNSIYGKIKLILLEISVYQHDFSLNNIKKISSAINTNLVLSITIRKENKTKEIAKKLGFVETEKRSFNNINWYELIKKKVVNDEINNVYLYVFDKEEERTYGTEEIINIKNRRKKFLINEELNTTNQQLSFIADKFRLGDDKVISTKKDQEIKIIQLIKKISDIIDVNKIERKESYIEQGNIIEDNEFIIIGRNSLNKKNKQKLTKKIYTLGPNTKKHSFFYNDDFFYHIDMYLLYIGRTGALNKHTVFLGYIPEEVLDENIKNQDFVKLREANIIFNDIQKYLQNEGFETIRIPMLYYNQTVFSLLNSIVEIISEEEKNIFIPKYSLGDSKIKKILRKNVSVFKSESKKRGFCVIETVDFTINQIVSKASLHCCVNILKRENLNNRFIYP